MNSLQTSTVTELDLIFKHSKFCIFKNTELAVNAETFESQTNGNIFTTAFLNADSNYFNTDGARIEFINEYENFINLFPNSNNLPSIVYMLTDFMIQEIDNKEIILSNLNKLKNKHLESLASEEIDKIIYRKKLK